MSENANQNGLQEGATCKAGVARPGAGMNSSPPISWPAIQRAAGASPRGKKTGPKLSSYVRIVNPVWNGSGFIKRKKAIHYVKHHRGAFLDSECNQLLLDMNHAENIAAARTAANGYNRVNAEFTWGPGVSGGATVLMAEKVPASIQRGQAVRPLGRPTSGEGVPGQ